MFLANKVDMALEYTCGGTGLVFSGTFPYIISTIVTVIKIAVPILLIIFGMLDLGKAVVAAKEDEIKKGQQTFIKRIIAAAIVFFVITIVKMVLSFLAGGTENGSIYQCVNCFIEGSGSTACANAK
jgi:hypothetical protein